MIDGQSAKTTGVGGVRGYDGAKKLSGRKRHLLEDTIGLVLQATVHSAELQDPGVPERSSRLHHVWADQGDTGSSRTWIETHLGWTVEIVRHPSTARGEG